MIFFLLGGVIKNFSPNQQKVLTNKENHKTKRKSSLNNWWFRDWSFQSEGGSDVIYLVDLEGLSKEIKAKVHGQKERNLNDGVFIDRRNTWFGYRSIPLSNSSNPKKEELQSLLEMWEKVTSNLLYLDFNELKELSKWFHNLKEEDKCEIIDIFMDCEKFSKIISLTGSGGEIKNNFKLNFEKLNELANKNWGKELPQFADIIGYKGVIYISRLSGFESKFGNLIDLWIKEEIKKEGNKLTKDSSKKKNGIHLIKSLFNGIAFSEGCSEYEKSDKGEKIIFGECFSKSDKYFDDISKFEGEKYFFPKVIDVIKAGQMLEKPMYAPSRLSLKNSEWIERANYKKWEEIPENLTREVLKGYQDNNGWKGIIDASCSNVKAQWGFSWLISTITGTPLEQMGCWEFYNFFFTKEDFENKRYCLFSMPEAKSFMKETQIFGPFIFFDWNKGNQFWAKCHKFGL